MVQGDFLDWNPLEKQPDTVEHPLLSRAWVYQERKLSARMVHFTRNQLLWECKTVKETESGREYLSLHDRVASSWHSIINEYSGLHLTFDQDRLPAIAAIVEDEMKVRRNDTYIAGMWRETLLTDLTWQRYKHPQHPRPCRAAPSWSWASIDGGVYFRVLEERLPSVEILDATFTPKEPAHMGGQSDASLVLRGPMTEAAFDPLSLAIIRMRPRSLPPKISSHGLVADYNMKDECSPRPSAHCFFAFIRLECVEGIGLVLRQLPDGNFERIGTCTCFSCNPDKTEDWETKRANIKSYMDSLPINQVRLV